VSQTPERAPDHQLGHAVPPTFLDRPMVRPESWTMASVIEITASRREATLALYNAEHKTFGPSIGP
jgi:hypothetical protein